jgi:hypothetical protein
MELKAPAEKGKPRGRVSKVQAEFGRICLPGYYWAKRVCYGVDEAIEFYAQYLALTPRDELLGEPSPEPKWSNRDD